MNCEGEVEGGLLEHKTELDRMSISGFDPINPNLFFRFATCCLGSAIAHSEDQRSPSHYSIPLIKYYSTVYIRFQVG